MLRRLSATQPEEFMFSKANLKWAKDQLKKYPKGRQASAVIPLLWKAQEQEGWVSKPAIEFVANFLNMPEIRVLEVATFYFMFHLKPVGSKAHFQVCGTTPCMLRGSEDLIDGKVNMFVKHLINDDLIYGKIMNSCIQKSTNYSWENTSNELLNLYQEAKLS